MSNESEKQGYVVEGRMNELVLGWLVIWSLEGAMVPYSRVANQVSSREMVPELRRPQAAFAYCMKALRGITLPTLSELDEWDGPVAQQIEVVVLKKRSEYQICVKRKGRMRGKLHTESVPVMRVSYSPPEEFDASKWIHDYEKSFWEDGAVRPNEEEIEQCVSVDPYWDDTDFDINLLMDVRGLLVQAFRRYATGVDSLMVRKQTEKQLQMLNGIKFNSGKGAVFVPKEVNGTETYSTLMSLSDMIALFASGGRTENDNYYDADGNISIRSTRGSNLRPLGYLDGDKELEYIRQDIGDALTMEMGEYWAKVVKTAETFNEDNVEAFERKLSELETQREGLRTRIATITESIGGGVQVKSAMHADLQRTLNQRVSGMTTNRVVDQIRNLSVI